MDKGLLLSTGSSNINLNVDSKTLEACLKQISNLGGTVNMNICTGQSVNVPWGSADWISFLFIGTICLAFLGFIILVVVALIKG